ncbi:hypothetical protein ACXYTJ_09955 [Gilvimarinus sp. F26214L]|uniref:hypothetical protein n=1 Tax=Gilvimarinus sp. DZF01 TaxID=3461371 RepID=UPI004046540D
MRRSLLSSSTICAAALLATLSMGANAKSSDYEAPRNSLGQPDLSGFWSNASLTPLMRPKEVSDRLVYTEEEVAVIEGRAETLFEENNRPTDPDAPAEYRHKTSVTRPEFEAAGGDVGGYNTFWLDPGNMVMRVGGEPRTSILTTPNGQAPARKKNAPPPPARHRAPAGEAHYETRSLGERCIIGFGRNGGPPMFANGFYNNNYHIVQAPEHVMILVEMNHDARIIRLDDEHRTDDVRPWFGDSIGWWEGDTLVVETINLPPEQHFFGAWENLKVTERFTRVAEDRLHYEFSVEDPTVWKDAWGGEYEFSPLDGEIFEYACHEGNYSLPGILSGARMEAEKE